MTPLVKRVAKAICCPSGTCENDGRGYDPIKGSVSICQAQTFEREAFGAIAATTKQCIEIAEAAGQKTGEGEGEIYITRKIADQIRALLPHPASGDAT